MRSLKAALVAVVLAVGSIGQIEAGVVTPGPSVSTNILPFGGTNDVRYQQIYDSSLFNAAPDQSKSSSFGSAPTTRGRTPQTSPLG